jgi:hypothetical protein
MSDNIAITVYFVIGYVITYLALETVQYFTACKIPDKPINLLYEFELT